MQRSSLTSINRQHHQRGGGRGGSPVINVKLERILGITVPNNAGLASAPSRGIVAYPAGCTVVLYYTRKNKQSHIINASRKTITSLAFSEDGRYLVTGECGHAPCVRIWDVQEKQQISEFPGHKYGVNVVAFAPNGKYVVSVDFSFRKSTKPISKEAHEIGSQQDMIVNVWDWHNNIKVASNKISTKVKAISFAENGNYFVTAGNRHIKFWYLEYSRSKYKEPVPLMGRSAILGEQRNNYFCDVACGKGDMGDSTFAVTRSGLLCEFNNRRLLDKWVELKTQGANCLTVGEDFIFIGCSDGIVRCFSPHTLQFITTLPRTHYLGVDVSKGLTISHMVSHPPGVRYPDASAVTYDEQNFKVTVIYNDHSFYVWDVRDIKKVGKTHSFIFHSACIWGVETYPVLSDGQKPVLPPGSFVTCSSDDTIRIWNLSNQMANNTIYKRNIYSDDLLKTLYIDPDLNHIKENDPSNTDNNQQQKETTTNTVYDQKNGVRCIRISPDGKHLASGDRAGNIRIHDIQFMDELCKIEAHDAEVLCLEYSSPVSMGKVGSPLRQRSLLASASRDRLIHLFDVSREYSFLQTLDDHSSSITAIRFLKMPPRPGVENSVQIASCGADKSIIFRDISSDHKGGLEFTRGNHIVGKTTLYDMETDYNHKHILTACQDRNVRVYTVGNGKHIKTFKGSNGEDGTLIKVVLDRSGVYLATSCTDKTLAIYDFHSGECMATMFGHSELVTGLKFTNDCKHLISVSGDGCIFVWRLPQEMTSTMLNRLAQLNSASPAKSRAYIAMEQPQEQQQPSSQQSPQPFKQPPPPKPAPETEEVFTNSIPERRPPPTLASSDNDYRFSVGKLPVWAKKQLAASPGSGSSDPDLPKGRWAARIGDHVTVKSHYDSDSVIPFPGNKTNKNNNNNETSEHDADIDEYSDALTMNEDGGESTEPDNNDKTLFFGGQNHETPGNYTVNAIDAEELRKSQRRPRPSDLGQQSNPSNPSQESDFDEDEDGLSTPTAEKSMTSMLSVSSENVDRVGRRERFMKNNFESLSGADQQQQQSHNTISNQFREGSALQRNAATIARAQSLRDADQNKRREELQARIEKTRLKLQNIGYQSMLKGSQSISDLTSHLPPTDRLNPNSRPESAMSDFHTHVNNNRSSSAYVDTSSRPSSTEPNSLENNSSLRRACSLSDLNRPAVTKRLLPAPPVSGKKNLVKQQQQQQRHRQQQQQNHHPHMGQPVQHQQQQQHPHMGHPVQHQQQQPEVGLQSTSPEENVPSYMRSTSASTKKERPVSSASLMLINPRRRSSIGQTQSQLDLRTVAVASDEDTSSEENLKRSNKNRRRSSSHDRRGSLTTNGHLPREVTQSERDLTKVTKVRVRTNNAKDQQQQLMSTSSSTGAIFKPRTKMKTTTMIINQEVVDLTKETKISTTNNVDVVRAPLNWQLVDQTASQLQKASDDLVQLYKRISLDYDMEDRERAQMLQKLGYMAGKSQQTLKPVNLAISSSLSSSELRPALAGPNHPGTLGPADPYPPNVLSNQGPSWC